MGNRKEQNFLLVAALVAVLAGCDGGVAGSLRNTGIVSTPDEFMVLPTRPLEIPTNMERLPAPVPGSLNRVDQRPQEEAVAGLTGRSSPAGSADGSALVAVAGPGDPSIRRTLAVEDAEYRSSNGGKLFERWFTNDQEALIYRRQVLNAPDEFNKVRGAGVRVPAPPPSVAEAVPLGDPKPDPQFRGWRVPWVVN